MSPGSVSKEMRCYVPRRIHVPIEVYCKKDMCLSVDMESI